MHELTFAQGVIKLVDSEAKEHGFTCCVGITISIGKYSGVIPGCVDEMFKIASKGTICENASLSFNEGIDPFKAYVDSIEVG